MSLNKNKIARTTKGFKYQCIIVLIEGYKIMKREKLYSVDCYENFFTANLIVSANECDYAKRFKIDLVREPPIDKEEILTGIKNPNKAVKIDIRFCSWINKNKIVFLPKPKIFVKTIGQNRMELKLMPITYKKGI